MIVAGGYYREICAAPRQDNVFGSGGRAALALAVGGVPVEWHYYCPKEEHLGAQIGLSHENLSHRAYASHQLIRFEYFHPLSKPVYYPATPVQENSITVTGDVVLRYGFMEGDAVVHGKKVVFDPQSPNQPTAFSANGSTGDSLSIVLNNREVLLLGEAGEEAAAVENICKKDGADVVLVKSGPQGCRVYVDGELQGTVPPYETNRVYKIGSGDVFSAAYSYHWAQLSNSPTEAADAASRCVARYCDTLRPSVLLDESTAALSPIAIKNRDAKVYIAGPFFTMAELWLIEEACRAFHELGVNFFSPYHEAGLLGDYENTDAHHEKIKGVVEKDLTGLSGCSAVFAILDGCDPGTLFEIGWAARQGIPVIAFSQNPKPADQTMIVGSENCSISDDFASAIYRTAWAATT